MPVYEYEAVDAERGCDHCRDRFEHRQQLDDPPLQRCPRCGAPLRKCISLPSVGGSKSGFDDRAKSAGFHKLERRGKGEYEARY